MDISSAKIEKILLVVEDEPELADIIKETLEPLCDKVLTAAHGGEALTQLQNNPNITAVISDISMPVMNGLQLLAEIRKSFNAVPFVVLTGFGDSKSYQEAIKLNATDFLEKPFNHDDIVRVMKKALEYGHELQKADLELNKLYSEAGLTAEKIEQLKRAKRTTMAMRIENSIYVKDIKK